MEFVFWCLYKFYHTNKGEVTFYDETLVCNNSTSFFNFPFGLICFTLMRTRKRLFIIDWDIVGSIKCYLQYFKGIMQGIPPLGLVWDRRLYLLMLNNYLDYALRIGDEIHQATF